MTIPYDSSVLYDDPNVTFDGNDTVTSVSPTWPASWPPLTGSFQEEYRVTLLDRDDRIIRPLTEFTGRGTIEQNRHREIRGGGSIEIQTWGTPDIDFGSNRVQIHRHVVGQDQPLSLGVYLLEAPTMAMNDENEVVTVNVTLLDKLAILAQDEISETFAVQAGDNVVDTAIQVIQDSTPTRVSIEPSDSVIPSDRVWPPGTSRLEIVNTLLGAINYFSIYADGSGTFVGESYSSPQYRYPVHTFSSGEISLHKPEWTISQDWANIPNQIVLKTRGDETTEGLHSVWQNLDPNSPYSIPRRGRVISLTEEVDAVDQPTLDALAARRGSDVSSKVTNLAVEHAVMDIWPNDPVALDTPIYKGTLTVSKWSLGLFPGAQMVATWREVSRDR